MFLKKFFWVSRRSEPSPTVEPLVDSSYWTMTPKRLFWITSRYAQTVQDVQQGATSSSDASQQTEAVLSVTKHTCLWNWFAATLLVIRELDRVEVWVNLARRGGSRNPEARTTTTDDDDGRRRTTCNIHLMIMLSIDISKYSHILLCICIYTFFQRRHQSCQS